MKFIPAGHSTRLIWHESAFEAHGAAFEMARASSPASPTCPTFCSTSATVYSIPGAR